MGCLNSFWGDIYGKVREFVLKALYFPGGGPNWDNPLKSGPACLLVIFF